MKNFKFLAILLAIAFSTNAFAQGPNAPEAASFEPVDATDMVNLATGDFTYVLPLMNVPSPEGGYPIALSYHAGIAMDQEASWVGLGWSLNPGAINRTLNGIADDQNGAKQLSMVYADLGDRETFTVGVSALWKQFSPGIDYTFVDGKGFGGKVFFGAGMLQGSVGYGQMLGSNSMGINLTSALSYRGVKINTSIGYDFMNKKVSGNAGISHLSTGMSLKSTGSGVGLGMGKMSLTNNSFNSITSSNLNVKGNTYSIAIPIKAFSLNLSYSKQEVSLFDNENRAFYGALYLKQGQQQKLDHDGNISYNSDKKVMDVSGESYLNGQINVSNTNVQSSVSLLHLNPSYDNYRVAAQGININIEPRLYEFGYLNNVKDKKNRVGFGDNNVYVPNNFTKSYGGLENEIFFYDTSFNNGYYGLELLPEYLQQNNPTNNIFDVSQNFEFLLSLEGENGVSTKQKRRGGNDIASFTNSQIRNGTARIVEASKFDRSTKKYSTQEFLYPDDGIGAFKVTTVDGKTYHYSLPVYHFESFNRSYDKNEGVNNKFTEISKSCALRYTLVTYQYNWT